MCRLMDAMVLSGLVMACLFAVSPTSLSPFFVNATTDGVVLAPFCVSDYGRFSTFQYSDTAVCCSQINSNYFAHFYYLSFLKITLLLRP